MSLFLDLLFPKTCFGCQKNGRYFCSKCLSKIKTQSIKINSKNQFEGCLSVFPYKSLIKSGIAGLKYNFITDLSDELAFIVSKRIKSDFKNILKYWQKNKFVLLPVPLHNFRQNWRGFNQSSLLGRKIAKKLKLGFSEQILVRKINTISQTKFKDKSLRKNNVENIFGFNQNIDQKEIPKNIILFDDISTTFSTLNSLSLSLKTLEINHIWTLTIAG